MIDKTITLPEKSFFTTEEVQRFRTETQGCNNVIHLNNAGAGLMPDVVTQAQLDHINLEAQIGGYEASALRADVIRAFYQEAAMLLNTQPANLAFTASATDSYTRALSAIPFKSGDVILTDKDDFVSNQIQFLSLQKRLGIKIVHIENAAHGGVDLADMEGKLMKYRPKLLAITHIPTNSGLVQPVDDIAVIFSNYLNATSQQTWYILDACQSVGQMRLDVAQLKCDFLSITCRKFLRGPRGTGALFISNRALQAGLEPMFIDMRGAIWTDKGTYKQQPDAKRFEDWEFAYATVIGTKVAIQYCRGIGEEKIGQQVKLLSGIIRSRLTALDSRITVLDKGPELGGLVTFSIKNGEPARIASELLKRNINAVPSYRQFGVMDFDEKKVSWAIRVSPHYYNTLNEIDFFIESMKEIVL